MDKHHIIAILAAILYQSSQELTMKGVVTMAYDLYEEVCDQSPHLTKNHKRI